MNLLNNPVSGDKRVLTIKTIVVLVAWGFCWIIPILMLIATSTMAKDTASTYFTLPNVLSDAANIPLTIEFFFTVYFIVILKDWVSLSTKGYLLSNLRSKGRSSKAHKQLPKSSIHSSRKSAAFSDQQDNDEHDDDDMLIDSGAVKSSGKIAPGRTSRIAKFHQAPKIPVGGNSSFTPSEVVEGEIVSRGT